MARRSRLEIENKNEINAHQRLHCLSREGAQLTVMGHHSLLSVLLISVLLRWCYAADPIPDIVYPADSFVDTVCVNTHFTYPTYINNSDFHWNLLKQTGIRTIRDGYPIVPQTTQHAIKIVVGVAPSPTLTYQSLQDYYSVLKQNVLDGALIASFEGPNEPNGFWVKNGYKYNGVGYPDGVLPLVQDIWNIVKNDDVLKQNNSLYNCLTHLIYPIIGPAYSQASAITYGAGAFTPYIDYGGMHPYPTINCYQPANSYAGIPNYFCNSNDPINTIASDYTNPFVWAHFSPPYSPKPFAFSETGYATTLGGTSELAHGKYIPRVYMENYRLGIWKTCVYEWFDQGSDRNNVETNYGFLRHDLTPKPALYVIRDLIALLSDPGPAFTPTNISFSINVSPVGSYTRTNFVHHLLFQKRNGEYYLALWHEIALENVATTPVTAAPTPPDLPTIITIAGGHTISSGVVYSWDDGGVGESQPASISDGNKIVTAAQAQIRIIKFTLAGGPTQVHGLQGYYYSGNNFGALVSSRLDATVNFNFGDNTVPSGLSKMPADHYSIRWVGQIIPQCTGEYTFYVSSDDGNRLYINGVEVINQWVAQAVTESAGTITLNANQVYDIDLQYFQNAGGAIVKLSWSSGTCQPKQVIPSSSLYAIGDGLFASYYIGKNFEQFVANSIDATVDFNFGNGSPTKIAGMPVDRFSIQWVGQVLPRCTGTYTFYVTSDDGSMLYVDSQLVVSAWGDQANIEHSGTINLTAGKLYPIEVQYYENGGGAQVHLSWSAGACEPKAIIPQSQLFSSSV